MDPCEFWKENQYRYPVLASIARDVLSIPATGAGVEQLFNSARDICHYRRGSLKTSTIQELMMFMCTSKFEVEEEQLALNKEYLLKNELQEAEEDTGTQLLQDDLDPISDNEEDGIEPAAAVLETVLGKRRKSTASVLEEESHESHYFDNDTDNLLPANQQTLRSSGRPRKQVRQQDDEFAYY
jgi:transcriptional regulator of heat shock response